MGWTKHDYEDIPGTYVFDGKHAYGSYPLNKLLFSFCDEANRNEFERDPSAYCDTYGVTGTYKELVLKKDFLGMLRAGANIYYLAKMAIPRGTSVQEAGDMAAIAHAAALESRVPFMHFFDGFRTSHELAKVKVIGDDVLRALIDERTVLAHRDRALSPERPAVHGTAQNPDVYFQARESANPYYFRCAEVVHSVMRRFAALTGRAYGLVEYAGASDATRVVILMGSGAETAEETAHALNLAGTRVGVAKLRLYRPFPAAALLAALPPTTRAVAVLDRTKEPGSAGEPLYLDVVAALSEAVAAGQLALMPRVIGGRYGLSSKEFTPAMVAGIFEELARPEPKRHFTVGIVDDVSGSSIGYDRSFSTEAPDVTRAVFHGLVNSGVVALLALALQECFGPARIGRLLGVTMVACMLATVAGNQTSAWVFERTGSYVPMWRAYAWLMLAATGLTLWLRRPGWQKGG